MNLIPWKNKEKVHVTREAEPTVMSQFRSELGQFFDRWDRWVREPIHEGLFRETASWMPIVDVADHDDEILITAEMPGLDPDDVQVSVTDNVLTIKAEKRDENEERKQDYYYCERRFGSATRTIELPSYADVEHVEAEQQNGVLTVHVKKLATKIPQKIEVKEGAFGKTTKRELVESV